MILAGDIGGTNCRLAAFRDDGGELKMVSRKTYPSKAAESIEAIVAQYVADFGIDVQACCLGVPGPVKGGICRVTNLPWVIDARSIAALLKIENLALINDLVANAYGLRLLGPGDILEISQGVPDPDGNLAVISPGTGLGESGVLWLDDSQYLPFASEGGHCDFGPRTELQFLLAKFLLTRMEHVSYERILCGDGLGHIYDFILEAERILPDAAIQAQFDETGKSAVISSLGMSRKNDACVAALNLFLEIYGQEAGNLALKVLATGGIYLGGGISAKLANAIRGSSYFIDGFKNKGKMRHLLSDIPIKVILNDEAALLGAAYVARERLRA